MKSHGNSLRCTGVLILTAAMCLGAALRSEAITFGNTLASSEQLAQAGNESASLSFDNDGEFLAVVVAAASVNDGVVGTVTPTVTYGGVPLTPAETSQRRNRSWSGVYYLAEPLTGANSLVVDLGDVMNTTDGGAWQFGAISMSGVDEANPIAGSRSGLFSNTPETITSSSPGSIGAGDALVMASTADNSVADPNWTVPTNSQIQLLNNPDTSNAGGRFYDSIHAILAAGDLSGANSDELDLTPSRNRPGARSAVVFNTLDPDAPPPPSSIYEETFDGELGKGATGAANFGDPPVVDLSGVDWTVDVSQGNFTSPGDWFRVVDDGNGGTVFEAQDPGGPVKWYSPLIDIAGETGLELSMFVGDDASNFDEAEHDFMVFYTIDGLTPVMIFDADDVWGPNPDDNDNLDQTLELSLPEGDELQLMVMIDTRSGIHRLRFGDILVTADPSVAVPEPVTALLALLGGAALWRRRRAIN